MRISIKAGRSQVLAIAASVLVSGSALAAAAVPAGAATTATTATAGMTARAAAPAAPAKVTVNNPGATTEPAAAPIDLALTANDSNPAGYPLVWSATGLAALGLTVAATNANGTDAAITGTAPAADAGTHDITVFATDANLKFGEATFALTLGNVVTVTNPGAQAAKVGTAIAPLTIKAKDSDAAEALTYAAGGTLPTGLAINAATGVITGTPTAAGAFPVTITVTDPTAATGAAEFTWTVTKPDDKIAVKAPVNQTVWFGVPATIKPTATDSAAGQKLTWSATGLPPGLGINAANGVISGKATKLAGFTSVVKATDGTGSSGTATIKWFVAVPVIIPNDGTQTTSVGSWLDIAPFTYTDAVPGDKPTFSATGLPSGMSFRANPMLLYGWPASAGTYHVTIHEHGSLGSTDEMTFKLVVTGPTGGASGQIRLPLAGKCLQDPGNRNGVRAAIEGCVSSATEHWTVDSDNTIRANGHCLTVAGSGTSNGRQLVLAGCTGSTRQRWAQGTYGELVNPASGLCVTDPGSSKRNGTVPVMGACRVKPYAQWALPAQRVLTALGGSCLDTSSNGKVGNVVDMFWCKYSGSRWTFERDGTIRMFGNQCVTVKSKKAVMGVCSASNKSQKWTVARTSAMGSELAQGGLCLAIPSLTSAKGTALEPNGTQLIVSKCSNTDPRDLWHIE